MLIAEELIHIGQQDILAPTAHTAAGRAASLSNDAVIKADNIKTTQASGEVWMAKAVDAANLRKLKRKEKKQSLVKMGLNTPPNDCNDDSSDEDLTYSVKKQHRESREQKQLVGDDAVLAMILDPNLMKNQTTGMGNAIGSGIAAGLGTLFAVGGPLAGTNALGDGGGGTREVVTSKICIVCGTKNNVKKNQCYHCASESFE